MSTFSFMLTAKLTRSEQGSVEMKLNLVRVISTKRKHSLEINYEQTLEMRTKHLMKIASRIFSFQYIVYLSFAFEQQ